MKLRTILSAVAIGAFGTAALAGGHAKDVKVGMITTLSGGGAGLGIDVRDGFLLAVKMSGNDHLKVVVEDDQRKPDIAVQLADKMIQSEKVDVLTGIIWSNLAMAVVPSATAQGKFYLSPNAGPSALAGKGCHQNYFNVAWQNDNLHEAAGGYANSAGFKKSFILAPNYPAGQDALTGYKRVYGGDLAGELFTELGQKDYAAEIAQIRASDADSVFFFLPGGMGISFLKQYADSGVNLPVVGPAFSFDQGILQAVGEAALGVKNTSQWNKDIDNAANNAFVEAFQSEYGRLPSLYASQGYDTANLLLSAMGKADIDDPDAFRAALKEA
ncbi:MAG: ABC transporter substrate-binding protein, partial [Pseudomonadota bacterium]